jgi:hypothetical protein
VCSALRLVFETKVETEDERENGDDDDCSVCQLRLLDAETVPSKASRASLRLEIALEPLHPPQIQKQIHFFLLAALAESTAFCVCLRLQEASASITCAQNSLCYG